MKRLMIYVFTAFFVMIGVVGCSDTPTLALDERIKFKIMTDLSKS